MRTSEVKQDKKMNSRNKSYKSEAQGKDIDAIRHPEEQMYDQHIERNKKKTNTKSDPTFSKKK